MYLFQSKVPMSELNKSMDRLEAIIVQLGGREIEKKIISAFYEEFLRSFLITLLSATVAAPPPPREVDKVSPVY